MEDCGVHWLTQKISSEDEKNYEYECLKSYRLLKFPQIKFKDAKSKKSYQDNSKKVNINIIGGAVYNTNGFFTYRMCSKDTRSKAQDNRSKKLLPHKQVVIFDDVEDGEITPNYNVEEEIKKLLLRIRKLKWDPQGFRPKSIRQGEWLDEVDYIKEKYEKTFINCTGDVWHIKKISSLTE